MRNGKLFGRKKTIKENYFDSMLGQIIMLVINTACIILTAVFYDDFFGSKHLMKIIGTVIAITIIVILSLMAVFQIRSIILLLMDYDALKHRRYVSVIGKVVGFKRNEEPNSQVQINDTPMIINQDTGEKIILRLKEELLLGGTYKFNYLKHSKIAELSSEYTKE